MRRTICLNEDRPYGQSNPRNLLRVQCARLLTLAYSHARYFTEIYFSRIVILGVAGKRLSLRNDGCGGEGVCVAEYARCSDDPWAKVAVVYIYIYML